MSAASPTTVAELQSALVEERFYGPGLRFCLERMGDVEGKRILEIGCGRGELTVMLGARGAHATGIDLRSVDLEHARGLAGRMGVTCSFVQADAHDLPSRDAPFDIVLSKSTLQYMDRRFVLEACIGALAPGGMLALNENLPANPAIGAFRCLRTAAARVGLGSGYAHSIRGYLSFEDIQWLARRFAALEHREAHLLRVLVAPHNGRRPGGFLGILDDAARGIDDALLSRVPAAKRFAWLTAIVARGPLVADGRGQEQPARRS